MLPRSQHREFAAGGSPRKAQGPGPDTTGRCIPHHTARTATALPLPWATARMGAVATLPAPALGRVLLALLALPARVRAKEMAAMAVDALYPPGPANVPPKITRIDGAYRLRVVAMIGGLFVFLLLYLVFIAAAGLLAYGLLVMPLADVRGRGIILILIFKFGGAFSALLLWLFLLKGLFKGRTVERSGFVTLR